MAEPQRQIGRPALRANTLRKVTKAHGILHPSVHSGYLVLNLQDGNSAPADWFPKDWAFKKGNFTITVEYESVE